MKIKYHFLDETVEVDVADEWGNILIDLDRKEYNNDRKESKRHYHLDCCEFEGDNFAQVDPSLTALLEEEWLLELPAAMAQLLPRQRQLIYDVFFQGLSRSEIARREGVDESAIRRTLDRAIKKLKKILSQTVRIGSLPRP